MTLETQWLALGTMLGSGFLLGVFLDMYRVLKGQWQLTGWVVALVDLCYWILAAGWVFSVLLWSTWGELRFYMLITLFTGLGAYYLWLSRPMIKALLFVLRVVQALIRFVVALFRLFLWTPLMIVGQLGWKLIKGVSRIVIALLRGVDWILQPLVRPLKPFYEPLRPFLEKVKKRFKQKDE